MINRLRDWNDPKTLTMRTDTMALPEDINTYIAAGGGLATTVIAYLTGRGGILRAKTDTKGVELENVTKAIKIWEDTATGLSSKVNALELKHDECEQVKDTLALTVRTLESDMQTLTHDTQECERRYNELSGELAQWKTYVGKHIGFPDRPNRGNE